LCTLAGYLVYGKVFPCHDKERERKKKEKKKPSLSNTPKLLNYKALGADE
jgi:hypothetical protein